MDDWIRLFNAESEADLDMIKTDNMGMRKAVEEVKVLSLTKRLRLRYEEHLKEIRDRRAMDEHIREEGIEEGERRFAELTKLMIDAGRVEDLARATEDKAYREQLCREKGI